MFDIQTTQACRECKEKKPLDAFVVARSCRSNKSCVCRSCMKARRRIQLEEEIKNRPARARKCIGDVFQYEVEIRGLGDKHGPQKIKFCEVHFGQLCDCAGLMLSAAELSKDERCKINRTGVMARLERGETHLFETPSHEKKDATVRWSPYNETASPQIRRINEFLLIPAPSSRRGIFWESPVLYPDWSAYR
jgi:hypothetical protein